MKVVTFNCINSHMAEPRKRQQIIASVIFDARGVRGCGAECSLTISTMVMVLYTFLDVDIMEKVLTEAPEQMIKLKAYKRGHIRKSNFTGHRFTRVSHQKRLPYSVWSHIVVESILHFIT